MFAQKKASSAQPSSSKKRREALEYFSSLTRQERTAFITEADALSQPKQLSAVIQEGDPPLAPGTAIQLNGMSEQTLNGTTGRIFSHSKSGRYLLVLDTGKTLGAAPSNIRY